MPERVLSDSSPLINLFLIGRFHLLHEFFKQIVIPEAVWRELVEAEKIGVDFFRLERETKFLLVEQVPFSPLLQLLYRELDKGEAEVIALALAEKADLLLLDEKEARMIARTYNLPLTGVVGILMRAKLEKRILSLQKELLTLQERGFWINRELFDQVLKESGEE